MLQVPIHCLFAPTLSGDCGEVTHPSVAGEVVIWAQEIQASSESSAGGKCVHDIREMQSTFNPSPSKSTTLSKKDLSCIVARFIRTQSSQRPRRSSELRVFHHFSLGTSYSKQLRGNFVPWQAFPNVDDLTFWLLYAEEKLLLEMKDRTCSNTCSQMDQIAVCIR